MDRETLINYGWIVIVTLVLAVMLAFATPFGHFVGKGAASIYNAWIHASENAMDSREELEQEWQDMFDKMSEQNNAGETGVVTNKIPEGGTYYYSNSVVSSQLTVVESNKLTAGSPFPSTVQQGDIFIYDGYFYVYQGTFALSAPVSLTLEGKVYSGIYANNAGANGWLAHYIGGETAKQPLRKIADKDVTSYRGMYYGNSTLVTIEGGLVVNSNITDIDYLFLACNNFTGTVTLNIADNVTVSMGPAPFTGTSQPITITGSYAKKGELATGTNITVQ